MERLLDALLNLECHALLHLQTVGIDVDYAGYLGKPCNVSVGDVGHMGLAIEGQHMVFAEGEEVDILDNDHLRVVFSKQGCGEHFVCVLSVALGKELHGFGHAHGSLEQTLTGGVFAKQLQYAVIML